LRCSSSRRRAPRFTQWQTVHADILVHFLRFMPVNEICIVPQLCRAYRDTLNAEAALVDTILKAAAIVRFPDLVKIPTGPLPIRELYQQCFQHERFCLWKKVWHLRQGRGGTRDIVEHQRTGERGVLKLFDGRQELAMGFYEEDPTYLDEGIPQTVLREIAILRELGTSEHIVKLKDVFLRPPPRYDALYLCYDHCESDLKSYIRHHPLSANDFKSLTYQMLRGLHWCHSHGILHRDVKPRNLFVNPSEGVLKLSGFGMARAVPAQPIGRTYTLEVVTLWYRAPELLLGDAHYGSAIDMWSVGAIIPEMLTNHPLLPGDFCDIDELFKIFQLLGTPTEAVWPGVSTLPHFSCNFPKWRPQTLRAVLGPQSDRLNDAAVDVVMRCLTYQPSSRLTALEALGHPFFDDFNPADIGHVGLEAAEEIIFD